MGYWKQKAVVEFRKLWAVVRKDKYERLVAELQDVLLLGWDEATRQAIAEVIRALTGSQSFSDSDLNTMLQQLRVRLGIKFANDVAAPLFEIQMDTYVQGMKDIIRVKPTFKMIDQQALDALQRHNIFWVRNFWDAQLGQEVADLGRQVLEQGLTREQAGKLFEAAFSGRFQTYSWRYWQGFANHVVTRSRELGRVEGYVRAGIQYLEVRAVLDRRTTRICREMHGRIIPVEEAVALRDALINAKDPEEVKQIAPWRKPEEIEGKPTSKLPKGMALPPYHFNCRTRTIMAKKVPAINEIDFEAAGAAGLLKEALRQSIANQEQLKVKEIKTLITRAMQARWPEKKFYDPETKTMMTSVRYHYKKHKKEKYTQWQSLAEMNQAIEDLIRKAGRDIYLQWRRDDINIIFYNGKVFVVIDIISKLIRTIRSAPGNQKLLEALKSQNAQYLHIKRGRAIMKGRKPNADEVLEFAVWTWLNQYEFLLEEGIYWLEKALIIKYRSLIQDNLEKLPEETRAKIADVDQWLLDHAEHPKIVELLTDFTHTPKMTYWWEDIDTLLKEREKRQKILPTG